MAEQIDHQYVQTAVVKKINSEQAELELADGQKLQWPTTLLPSGLQMNDKVRILVHDQKTEEDERKRLAKVLLNAVMHAD